MCGREDESRQNEKEETNEGIARPPHCARFPSENHHFIGQHAYSVARAAGRYASLFADAAAASAAAVAADALPC